MWVQKYKKNLYLFKIIKNYFFPLILTEFCTKNLYHISCEASAQFTAFFEVVSEYQTCHKTGGVHVAGTSGVDNVHFVASDSHFLIAALNHRAFASYFHDCYLAML